MSVLENVRRMMHVNILENPSNDSVGTAEKVHGSSSKVPLVTERWEPSLRHW